MQSVSKMIRETDFTNPYPKLPPSIDVGDRVVFKSNLMNGRPFNYDHVMIVDEIRIMLAKNDDTGDMLRAYTVIFPNGDVGEYDETQLVSVEE